MNSTDPQYTSFRAWALQQDLISLLGGGSDWRAHSPELGLEDPEQRDLDSVRGQAYLRRQLAPDQRVELRAKMMMALAIAAVVTEMLNQWGPTGIPMPTGAFVLVVATMGLVTFCSLFVFLKLTPRQFVVVEQSVLVFAYGVVAYQCSVTGGTNSPYMVWFVLAAFYPSYLHPERQAWANLAAVIGLASTGLFLGDGSLDDDSAIIYATLALTALLIGFTLIRQHRFEANTQRAVQFLALADPLTGVANLRAFEQMVAELARSSETRFAVVMADMDGLKGANAVFGQEAGDGMVLRMSRLMMHASSQNMQVARIGGDEFAIVLPKAGRDEARAWIERFDTLTESHNAAVKGRLPQVSAATGIAVYPDNGTSAGELIDFADIEMYKLKSAVVTPPHEIDVVGGGGPSHQLRAARFANAPRRIVETRERFVHAALNFLTIGVLLLATSTTTTGDTPAAVATGCVLFVFSLLAILGARRSHARSLSITLDVATIVSTYFVFSTTGGAASPVQMAMIIPVAFYAQYLSGRGAAVRIALVMLGWSIAFWSTPEITAADEALFATMFAASIIIALLLQSSQRSLTTALEIVRDSATHDPLTKAPNAHAFDADLKRRLAEATRNGVSPERPALLTVDVDDFRAVNTRYGHRGGDQILIDIHERLRETTQATVYRTGGDEFSVILECRDLNEIRELAGRVSEALDFRALIDGRSRERVTSSCGFALWNVSLSADELIELASKSVAADKTRRNVDSPPATNVLL